MKARATHRVAEEHLWDVACWDDLFDDFTLPGVSFGFTGFLNKSYENCWSLFWVLNLLLLIQFNYFLFLKPQHGKVQRSD